jgi:protein Tex
LKLSQKVQVKVIDVDVARKRINLSIKQTDGDIVHKNQNANNRNNRTRLKEQDSPKKENKEENMSDALNALKKKFGK